MKKLALIFWVILLHPLQIGQVHAESTMETLNLRAAIVNQCALVIQDPVDFGGYISRQSMETIDTGLASIQCRGNTTFNITFGAGNNASGTQRQVGNDSGHYLAYELYQGSCAGNTFSNRLEIGLEYEGVSEGSALIYSVCGRLPGGQAAPPGYYDDSVLITVNW